VWGYDDVGGGAWYTDLRSESGSFCAKAPRHVGRGPCQRRGGEGLTGQVGVDGGNKRKRSRGDIRVDCDDPFDPLEGDQRLHCDSEKWTSQVEVGLRGWGAGRGEDEEHAMTTMLDRGDGGGLNTVPQGINARVTPLHPRSEA